MKGKLELEKTRCHKICSLGSFLITLRFPMPKSFLVTKTQLQKKFCHLMRDYIYCLTCRNGVFSNI